MAIGRVTFDFSQSGRQCMMTMDFLTVSQTDPIVDAVLANIVDAWTDNMRPYVSPQCTLDRVRWNAPFYERIDTVGLAGTASGNAASASNAVMIKKLVEGNHPGRMFHPGVLASQISADGTILTGHLANWQTACTAFLGEVQQPVFSGNVLAVVRHGLGEELSQITGLIPRSVIGTQRRRIQN